MAKKRQHKVKLATLLIVGEGPIDEAFIRHMKSLYDGPNTGQKLKVTSADGGSPSDIINTTQRKYRHAAYDKCFILLDEDVIISQQDRDKARKANIGLIISTPICLEGMLLNILDRPVPTKNATACKKVLHPQLSGDPTRPESYDKLFPKPVLQNTPVKQILQLRKLIENQQT